jgi:hypothetical protein
MPVRFPCPHCHKRLAIGSHRVGETIFCPVCAGSLTVPAALPRPLPDLRPGSRPAVPKPAGTHRINRWSVGLAAGLAALIVAVIVVVVSRGEPAGPPTAEPEPAGLSDFALDEELPPLLSKIEERPELPAPPAERISPPPVEIVEVKVEPPVCPAPALRPYSPPMEPEPVVKAEAKAPAEPEALPALFKVKVVRRHFLTDEDLRKQLLAAPALRLDAAQQAGVFADQPNRNTKTPTQLTAAVLKQRPDLAGLPVRMGFDCRLGKEAAENLQFLSRRLREHLTTAAKDGDPRKAEDHLRRVLLEQERRNWVQAEAIPTLEQMLQVENKPLRLMLVEILTQIPDATASTALARRALFDLSAEVREAAIQSLAGRAREEFRSLLMDGLRYPWAPVADHAAEALVALQDRNVVPQLLKMVEQPDPSTGFVVVPEPKKGARPDEPPKLANLIDRPTLMVREMVRINHLGNCLMCHAPSSTNTDLVRGLVPDPNNPIQTSLPYYAGDSGIFVRADMTYLKQDFSVPQPVDKPGPWPQLQRYDYMVRVRPAMPADADTKITRQREALLYALSQLEPDWKRRQR